MTLAGTELKAEKSKVIDVALKYGYDSPDSFTKAFVKFHGITPSAARKPGAKLKSFSRLSINITLKGGTVMDYRIEEKSSFTVLEKIKMVSTNDEINKDVIPDFWTESRQNGTLDALHRYASGQHGLFGICYGDSADSANEFCYSIATVADVGGSVPAGYRVTKIPASTWALFTCKGAMPNAIQDMWHRIYAEFFPSSAYQPTEEVDIEAYPDGDMSSNDYVSEIWVSVTKK